MQYRLNSQIGATAKTKLTERTINHSFAILQAKFVAADQEEDFGCKKNPRPRRRLRACVDFTDQESHPAIAVLKNFFLTPKFGQG